MGRIRRLAPVFWFLLSQASLAVGGGSGWSHIEFGGGNYGPKGYPGTDLGLVQQGVVTDAQYKLLYDELDRLIQVRGDTGIFYINDLEEETANYAKSKLELYARKRGYKNVQFQPLVGDFFDIRIPTVDSAHLRNPASAILSGGYRSMEETTKRLRKLANSSRSGLDITTFSHEKIERLRKSGLEFEMQNMDAPPYLYPDGTALSEDVVGRKHRTYHLPNTTALEWCRLFFRGVLLQH